MPAMIIIGSIVVIIMAEEGRSLYHPEHGHQATQARNAGDAFSQRGVFSFSVTVRIGAVHHKGDELRLW